MTAVVDERRPWLNWTAEQWTRYRSDIAAHLERDPDWQPGRSLLRLADRHLASFDE